MKRLLIFLFLCLLVGGVQANAFSAWTAYGDAWKATNDTYTLIMWNGTGSHTWLATGNASSVDVAIQAGGGGGAYGGGGGGGLQIALSQAVSGSQTISVGTGGTAVNANAVGGGINGTNSSFGTLPQSKGGGGGSGGGLAGKAGGSGGGGGIGTGTTPGDADYISPRQGYDGGSGYTTENGGGGGGASAVGSNANVNNGGAGGAGFDISAIYGSTFCIAGGGGGGKGSGSGTAGSATCGGGAGSFGGTATSGTAGTGGGGGGGGYSGSYGTGGAGGSGIVIIKYQTTTGTPLTSNFTSNATVGYQSPWVVAFTDTTTGSPTTWNWAFGDTYTSTSQNPSHVYTVANNYTVSLNTTNSTGFSLVTKYIELKTDDDIYLKSWMQFENATVIDLKGAAWTASAATTSATQKKWGAQSLAVTANDAYITAPSSALWDWGSSNAVMEFWIYPTTIVANKNLIARSTGTGSGNTTGWSLRSNSSGTGYYWRMGANTTPSFTLPLNTWTLVKIERDGGDVEIYKNGVIESDTSMPGNYDTANPVYIGQASGGADNTYYLEESRFTNGISREVGAYSPNYAAYNGNLYTNWVNINPYATFRYKTNPGDLALIANQTNGGMRNRTVQIQNMTNATYISGKVDFNPNVMMAQSVTLNATNYADLVLTSSNIDPVNGIVNFNVYRAGGISALFDNRTNLIDVKMLYWNYTTETQLPMYFAQGNLIDGQHNAAYPIFNYIATNVTLGDWGTPLTTPAANNTNPTAYSDVQFLGNSTNYPNAWNWSFGDGTYSSLQSPTHQYTTGGLKTVSLRGYQSLNETITNTTTLTNYINVSGTSLSGFTRQDLVMSPQFTLQVTFVDSSTNLPIPVVTVTDSIGGNQTTSTGVFTGTYEYSTVVLYAFSSGYDSKAASYVMDGDRVETVQLTKSTTAPTPVTFYQAQLYRLIFQNLIGTPLGGLSVTITPLNLTMNSTWTSKLVGISPQVDIQNGVISGITGSDGSFGTPLFTPLGYRINITGTAQSGDIVDYSIIHYPPSQGTDIILSLPTSVTGFVRITPTPAFITYNIYNQSVSNTTQTLSVNFNDPTGATNLTIVTVTNQSGSILSTTTYTGAAATNVVSNFTYIDGVTSPSGDILNYGFSAYVPTAGGWNNITESFDTNQGSSLTGIAKYDQWAAIIIMVIVGAAFTASTVYVGTIGVGLMGLFFCYVVKWLVPKDPTVFTAICIFWICIGIIGFIAKKSRSGN